MRRSSADGGFGLLPDLCAGHPRAMLAPDASAGKAEISQSNNCTYAIFFQLRVNTKFPNNTFTEVVFVL